MFTQHLKIPAKALLFGEYGVLYGGVAFVSVLPQFFFDVIVKIEKSNFKSHTKLNAPIIHIESEFADKRKDVFFKNALFPWTRFLKNHSITIQVNHSFEPSLGFGSSSALITALSYALFVFVHGVPPNIQDEFLWKKIRASLKKTQGTASGYDIGVQLAYVMAHRDNLFWTYQNKKNSIVPEIKPVSLDPDLISKMGCFVKTGIYSDTAQVLKNFSKHTPKKKLFFAQNHTQIAENFLRDKNEHTLHTCMNMSWNLAQKQKICLPASDDHLAQSFAKHAIPFKTMGSGFGDCLWVAASKEVLINSGLVKFDEIIFSFQSFVNECK